MFEEKNKKCFNQVSRCDCFQPIDFFMPFVRKDKQMTAVSETSDIFSRCK